MLRLLAAIFELAALCLWDCAVTGLELVKLWLAVKPVARIRQWRTKRKARKAMQSWHAEHPDEILEPFHEAQEGKPMALDLGTRTSTNAGVAGLAVVWVCQLVEQFAPGLLGANADDYLIVAAAWLVARFSKTPDAPKAL